jgi:hypothetical protein
MSDHVQTHDDNCEPCAEARRMAEQRAKENAGNGSATVVDANRKAYTVIVARTPIRNDGSRA